MLTSLVLGVILMNCLALALVVAVLLVSFGMYLGIIYLVVGRPVRAGLIAVEPAR